MSKEVKLHSLLAAEKTVSTQTEKLLSETLAKLGKEQYFSGHDRTLTLFAESPAKAATEAAGRDTKVMQTTVPDTLEYTLSSWIKREDLLASKNNTNRFAVADIVIGDTVLASEVPVDEIMGLETRLVNLRQILAAAPTLDASKSWNKAEDLGDHIWKLAQPEVAVKTEKKIDSVVLYPATEKHPAQIKEISKDESIGQFTLNKTSGAITAKVKADMLSRLDDMIAAVKQARTRANDVVVQPLNVGQALIDFIVQPMRAK